MSAQDLIIFNVGDKKFTTTLSTLRRHQDSRLAKILDGKDPYHKVVNGQVFIDRDWTLFKFILDYMRTGQITLSAEFCDYNGLAQEAEFYGLRALVHSVINCCRSRDEVLEVRFSVQDTHGSFRIFCSNNKTLEALATRISVYVEHPNLRGSFPHLPQSSTAPVPVQRPSHHDLVFYCGTDQFARDDFSARWVEVPYLSSVSPCSPQREGERPPGQLIPNVSIETNSNLSKAIELEAHFALHLVLCVFRCKTIMAIHDWLGYYQIKYPVFYNLGPFSYLY